MARGAAAILCDGFSGERVGRYQTAYGLWQMDLYDAITLALLIRSDPNQLPSYTFGTLVPVAFQCSAEDAVILCDGFFRERRSYCQFTRETRTAQVSLHSV